MSRAARSLIVLALTLPLLSGCVLYDRHGRVDPVASGAASALVGAAVVGGTILAIDHNHRSHRSHVRHHRHHHHRGWRWHRRH